MQLRPLRVEMEWSQAALAHVGVSRACVSSIETGRCDPSLQLAFKRCGSARRLASDFGASFE
jgi:DNA-binding XRE family transcriptional regulator